MRGEPFLSARGAAVYVGYKPGDGPARTDKAMRAFYAWVRRHRVPKSGRGTCLLFRISDLDAAVRRAPAATDFAELGRRHARGEALSA